MEIKLKRAYVAPSPDDGLRILVDRLWPRGIKKVDLKLDAWDKDLAPSTEAREAFGHKPEHWERFQQQYRAELDANPAAAAFAQKLKTDHPPVVTLVYGAKNTAMNQAVVLKQWLDERLGLKG